MRIPCPYCGSRDLSEFVYHGDATPKRPDPIKKNAAELFYSYVYLRENPAGPIRELWYHASGCRSWLIVIRDTRTHVIEGATLATEAAP